MNFKGMLGKIDFKSAFIKYVVIGIVSLIAGAIIHIWKGKAEPENTED